MIDRFFPFLRWFKAYGLQDLKADLVSGVTVALVLIPQSMAYAQLAGLPPYYGLYASFVPPVVAALFGSSRQLATGPVAVVSLMTAAALEPMAVTGSQGFIQYAILLALLVGIVQLGLGLFRLGVVVNLLSHPVLLGFTNAAAIVIATSQLGKFLGVPVEKSAHHFETIWNIVGQAVDYVYWPTVAFGLGAFGLMFVLKRISPRIPYVLAAVVVTTLISWAGHYGHDIEVPLDRIECKALPNLIRQFNNQLLTVESFNQTRLALRSELKKMEEKAAQPCSRCHPGGKKDLKFLAPAQEQTNEAVKPASNHMKSRQLLALHMMAGVIDEFIEDAKSNVVNLRAELTSFKLVKVEQKEGQPRFYEQSLIPETLQGDSRIWRIKAGNQPISENAIVLSGGGAILGEIPKGLPSLSRPDIDGETAGRLFVPAFVIALVGFMEAISIAKFMAAKSGQRLDPNQELIGQGLANIAGSFFQSFAVSGSFSRSAVNFQAGAKSGMSNIFSVIIVVLVMLFLTPLFYYLPQSVLAAIIMMAVLGLINFKEIKHIFKVAWTDGAICLITFITTLIFAPHLDKGVIIGVVLSLVVFFYRLMRPSIAELSLWKDGHFRSAEKFSLDKCKHLAVIRFDGPFFFANISYLEDEVLQIVRKLPELKAIILKCNGINLIDSSGEEALALLVDRLRAAGYQVYFSGIKEHVLEVLERSSLFSKIGPENIFPTVAKAVDKVWSMTHKPSEEKTCPLRFVMEEKKQG